MPVNKRPSKTKLINKKRKLKTSDRINDNQTKQLENNKVIRNLIVDLEQIVVDKYNNYDIYKIDEHFKHLNLYGNNIIIQIFRENYIKHKDVSNPKDPKYVYGYRMIDARERISDNPTFEQTPFPYVEKGVIKAISPEVQLNYAKKVNELNALGIKHDIKVPEVGDIVEIRSYHSSVWFKEKRYYIDKQDATIDYVNNPTDNSVAVFEHYYIFEDFDLQGFIKNDKYFYSDDKQYPSWYINGIEEINKEIESIDEQIVSEISTTESFSDKQS